MTTTTHAPYQLITGKWLVDGRGGRPVERGAVLLEGSKIRAVGAVNEVAAPEGAPVEVHDFPEAYDTAGVGGCAYSPELPWRRNSYRRCDGGRGRHPADAVHRQRAVILDEGRHDDPGQRGQELHHAVAEEGDSAGAGHGAKAVHMREPADHHRGAHVADGGRGGRRG